MTDGSDSLFNADLFKEFLTEYVSEPKERRIERIRSSNKALLLSYVSGNLGSNGKYILNVAFTSCKYNHAPDYMSSIDGSERATSKQRDEGEEELTHFSLELREKEAYVVFEERRSGVSIGIVTKYLSKRFIAFQKDKGFEKQYGLVYLVVAHDDFLSMVNRSERVSSAELYVDKTILGGEFLQFANIPQTIRDELVLVMLPERRHTIDKGIIREALEKLSAERSRISRIRIKIKDEDGTVSLIDTLIGKRKNEVTVSLNPNGVVNSQSMFNQLQEVLMLSGEAH